MTFIIQKGTDYFFTGDIDKAKDNFQTSLKYASAKDQIDRIKDALDKIGQAEKTGVKPIPKYQSASTDSSIPAAVTTMEKKLYGSTNVSDSLIERVSKLEKTTLGKNYDSDSLIIRVDRLKRSIIPEQVTQENNIQRQNAQNYDPQYEGTYIPEIMQQCMGKVSIFGKMPITVYFDDAKVKPYKGFYKDAVQDAMKEWEKATNNKIKFETVYEPMHPDIVVSWTENFEDFAWQPTLKKEDISAQKEKMKYQKANALVQVGSLAAMLAGTLVPGVGAVGYLGSAVASPYLQYKGYKTDVSSAEVKINTKVTEGMDKDTAKAKIKQIAMHQFGHALGIYGHSSNPQDIMYSDFSVNQLSDPDIKTINYIYKDLDKDKKKKKEG